MTEFTKEYGPRCPNHRVVLIKTKDSGVGICPISGAIFSYSEDEAEKTKKVKLTMAGKYEVSADWKVQHIEGEDQ